MVGAQDAQPVAQALFEQVDGLVEPARGIVGAGEVASGTEDRGVIGAEDAQAVGEIPLVQGDGLVEPARLPVGFCKVVETVCLAATSPES